MNDFTSLFRFKSWADAELLEALGAIDAASHAAEHKAAVRTVTLLRNKAEFAEPVESRANPSCSPK